MIRIGISSCFLHPDSERATFSKKTLLYFEQSMAHWVMNHGAFPILLPTNSDSFDYSKILDFVDGLLLHGGADLAPCSYGEAPLSPLWPGDAIRDQYEIALYTNAKKMGLPILGICRGMQLMNVAEGGSLFQDLNTQRESTQMHRNKELYDELFHPIELKSCGLLEKIYSEDISSSTKELLRVNSVHHQGIKKLASSLISEAYCPSDGLIEA
ncbi:MAG: gamma-glutamyl-gamma-aminobutyrate hydrolase family protein, partial [Bdellovibrionales bacterium]|nr:gamma-glutamyl-gamma-aminobutyrate hydrolase family protein [Bdellovibrionales bacterium]